MIKRLINGLSDQHLDAADRGLNYGDGLFETIQIRAGVPLLWERHLKRLAEGAKRLKIPFSNVTAAAFYNDCQDLLASWQGDAVLKLILTRGVSSRGYKIDIHARSSRISTLSAMPDLSREQRGISVIFCQTQLARQPLLAGIKHLNRLEQVLARSEWSDSRITEGIVCDTHGFVIEGCMSNLFWVKDGRLYTPDLSYSGVSGVIRDLLIEQSEKQKIVKVEQGFYDCTTLLAADEIFLTNSVFDILAVIELHNSAFADHRANSTVEIPAGPVTQSLQHMLAEYYTKDSSH